MRFDDHRGLIPDRIVLENGILRGTLVRSKTTGTGKQREELTIAVGHDVFLREPDWMCTGWRLWQAFDTPRDLFLGAPTPELDSMQAIEPSYADARGMNRALLSRMVDGSGAKLLTVDRSWDFGTEHSDRAMLPSLAACLDGVTDDMIDDIGRWSSRTSKQYVRTYLSRLLVLQGRVARVARTAVDPLATFGEADLFTQWAQFMQRAGISQERAIEQASAVAHVFMHMRKNELAAAPATPTVEEVCCPEPPDETRHEVAGFEPLPLGTYVASVQKKGRFMRLHRVGECSLHPGVDYKSFTVFGMGQPPSSQYSALCRHCFKDGVAVPANSSDESATSASECA